ncbi:MAG TPA: hypothetical protein VLA68_05395 [Nitrososphaera sp.]|nr:hypothetical protein [Nitrososphaera sp.]
MIKPTLMALGTMAALFTAVGMGYIPQAFGQYFGGDSAPLTEEQLAKCEQYDIEPCTQNNILAKERLIAAQNNPSTGSGTSMLSSETTTTAVFIGVLGAIFGGVAAAFFLKGRGAKPVST